MTRVATVMMALLAILPSGAFAQQRISVQDLQNGMNFIQTRFYSAAEDSAILVLYEGLRVADVTDGLDRVGLPGVGMVSHDIHPDWVDTENMSHVIRGVAVTVRYVPTQRPMGPEPGQDWNQWEGNFYNVFSSEPFTRILHKGHVVVIDDVEDADIGSIGSNNILGWYRAGAVGVVTDAASRDTDEVALQKVPLYLRNKGRGIRPGRNEVESVNRPIDIGGALVMPGDIIVADGDGVVVVPRDKAEAVAKEARAILDGDKAGRRRLYEDLGRPLDRTVQ